MLFDIGHRFNIYFATNRRLNGPARKPSFGERCHKDGPDFYRVGIAEVIKESDDLDEGYRVASIQLKGEGNSNPDNRGSDALFRDIRKEIEERGCDVLVYIHGFANNFEGSISRAAQLHEHYQVGSADNPKHPLVFAFCWPSNGRVTPPWEYFSDRNDARAAGPAMARNLLRFFDYMQDKDPCKQRIHLVAHSMGNWALRHAVQALNDLDPGRRFEHLFDNAFLMAADEDDDALERDDKLKPLLRLVRRIHVYHSHDDLSLVISDKTKFNPNRLGYEGPRNFSDIDSKIIAIDCERVDETEHLHVNHQYYRRRREVIEDINQVLAGKRPELISGREVIRPGQQYRIKAVNEEELALLDTPENPVSPDYVTSA